MSGALLLAARLLGARPVAAEPLASMAQRSDMIALARCVDTRSTWDSEGRVIVTDARLQVERSFKGHASAVVEVRILGGRVGDVAMGAAHATTLTPGDHIVALLRHSARGPYFVISSATAGVLRVTTQADQTRIWVGATPLSLDAFARQLEAGSP